MFNTFFYPNWLFFCREDCRVTKADSQSEDMETLNKTLLWASTKPRSALQDFEVESRFWLLLDRISDIICNGLKYVFFLSFSFLFSFLHAGSRWVLLLLCQKRPQCGKVASLYTRIHTHIERNNRSHSRSHLHPEFPRVHLTLCLGTVARPWDSCCEATLPTTGSSCHLLKDNVLQKAMLCLIYGRGQGSAM